MSDHLCPRCNCCAIVPDDDDPRRAKCGGNCGPNGEHTDCRGPDPLDAQEGGSPLIVLDEFGWPERLLQ